LIDLFNVSLNAGGAAEGSQGQAWSKAERAAPGSSTTSLRALKGRQKVGEDYCRNETNPPEAQQTLLVWMHSHIASSAFFCRPSQGLVSITLITRGGALRFAPRLPLATFFRPLRGGSFRKSCAKKKIRSRAFVSQMHSDSQIRTLLWFAALPPHSAERLCLSVLACVILGGYASSSEAQPQKNHESDGKAQPFRTGRRQSRTGV